MTANVGSIPPLRCRLGFHSWVQTQERDASLDNPGQNIEATTRCRSCGRERGSGTLVSTILFAGVAVAAVIVFYLVSALLGAVLMIGAIGGLGWAMGPAIVERVARWLGR